MPEDYYVPSELNEQNLNDFNLFAKRISKIIQKDLFRDFTAIDDNGTKVGMDFEVLAESSQIMFNSLTVAYMAAFVSSVSDINDNKSLIAEIMERGLQDGMVYKSNLNTLRKH